MFEIHISNRQSQWPIDEAWVRQVIRRTLEAQQVIRAELSVAILDDAAIHEINREHLQHDYPTDVISFLYDAQRTTAPDDLALGGQKLDGEILVSVETAQRVAAELGGSPQVELALYVVHGLLHLCGYDDQAESDRKIMQDREHAILQILNLTPHYGV